MHKMFMTTVLLFLTLFLILFFGWLFLGPAGSSKQVQVFVVPSSRTDFDVVRELTRQKLIRKPQAFKLLLNTFFKDKYIESGGYRLSQSMNTWQIIRRITGKPDLLWVTISFCPRKEQVGEKLAGILGWNSDTLEKWNVLYKDINPEYFEGVYYPDTYLIPVDETPEQVAQRFINHFEEKFAPYSAKFAAKNMKWTTGLKIASLIAREAAGASDMGLISGIIWNRLDKGMPLQIDATMQYTLGKSADGSWWGNISLSEKQSVSPYNSYLHKGLPPTPICSPAIEAIEAALNPESTDCLYYLHDTNKQIHCAKTYKDHLLNIQKYL